MIHTEKPGPVKGLGPIEQSVLETLWQSGPSTADECRESLGASHPLKDSTIRTVLRRLEEKGYLQHEVRGRTYVYRPAQPRHSVVAGAVRQIVDRFCGGSVEQLLLGMVDNEVLDSADLERLARQIAQRKEQKR
ncbi:MAG TPA: BlaI/MecI/CopY family transcriptional regulator [Candidatus Dormibacteraeota bacterium]|nr:BlaI/MecI/CopY family transcriptional regulator [Candidatus Dormibacteraeota bacterium]